MNAPFTYGEKVLLLDLKQRRYLITLAEGAEFHSHNGYFAHSDLVGQMEGVVVKSTKGSPYTALRPTLEDFVVEMPRGAQVIYPKDLAPICMLGDIAPGVRVLESGVGSGALSMAERTQKQKPAPSRTEETVEEAPATAASGDKLKAELDDLLDEIDGVLETNAEDFVKSYVQKGGQ